MALIVDGKMPKGCYEHLDELRQKPCRFLPMCSQRSGFRNPYTQNVIPSNCPILCEIPDEHGRLVDADALIEQVLNGEHPRYDSMVSMIRSAPTIVEASK